MNRPKNERLNCLRHMPPLHHVTGEKYDIMNSEVMDWIVKQPEVRQWLYDKITGGSIFYGNGATDSDTPGESGACGKRQACFL